MTADPSPSPTRLFTFASGGWVILVTVLIALSIILWAVAPAFMRKASRPPGDGVTLDSYRFDLSDNLVDRSLIKAITLHRDMVPVMTNPASMPGTEMTAFNDQQRGKFLVPDDRVIGVTINGESRAYPISILNVHEIVHDILGGTPIAVTYNWPCDSVRVFERTIEGQIVEFGVSGLLYNSNLLMYIKDPQDEPNSEEHAAESLWSQIQARAITGAHARAGSQLTTLNADLTNWSTWLERRPETSVIMQDPSFAKRYKGADPASYFINDKLFAPVAPLPETGSSRLKDKAIAVRQGDSGRIYLVSQIVSNLGEDGTWTDQIDDLTVHFEAFHDQSKTVIVTFDPSGDDVEIIQGFWFALFSMFPDLPRGE